MTVPLMDWARGKTDARAFLMWLYGAAGAGKSAIGYTLAKQCEQQNYLLATFFFSGIAPGRNSAKNLISTIAYQVARAIPDVQEYIHTSLTMNPMIFDESLQAQLFALIIHPLRQAQLQGFNFKGIPRLIIIDGLDECRDNSTQIQVVQAISSSIRGSGLPLRFLIASRPEIHLQATFKSLTLQPHLCRLALNDTFNADADIRFFLVDSFRRIKAEHPLAHDIPTSWPSAQVIDQLVRKSSGQFIYASTVVKYVAEFSQLPTRRLEVILGLQPHRGDKDMPFGELNALYMHILSKLDDIERTLHVLGVLLILNPFLGDLYNITRIREVDNFLFWSYGETSVCLNQMASVIKCQADDTISFMHASLPDFLLDQSRSREFHISQDSVLAFCTPICLRHLRNSHQPGKP